MPSVSFQLIEIDGSARWLASEWFPVAPAIAGCMSRAALTSTNRAKGNQGDGENRADGTVIPRLSLRPPVHPGFNTLFCLPLKY